jgi:hypothetical protein
MRDQRTPGATPDDPTHLKQALLGLVVDDRPGLWSLAELDRHLTPSGATRGGEEPSRAATEDAVEDLYAAGLLHRIGQYVFASRAALEAERIGA